VVFARWSSAVVFGTFLNFRHIDYFLEDLFVKPRPNGIESVNAKKIGLLCLIQFALISFLPFNSPLNNPQEPQKDPLSMPNY
jgi:hypothetical protein